MNLTFYSQGVVLKEWRQVRVVDVKLKVERELVVYKGEDVKIDCLNCIDLVHVGEMRLRCRD